MNAQQNPEYNNLLEWFAEVCPQATRDDHIKFDNFVSDFHDAAVQSAYAEDGYPKAGEAFTNGWNEAHDSCSEAVRFLLDNYGPGLSAEAKLALEWALDRITFVSYPSHTDPNG